VTTWYLDTSAALKLILAEDESSALIAAIDTNRPHLASSFLLETEMRRAVHRNVDLIQSAVTAVLDRLDLYPVTAGVFRQAGMLPGEHLASLDALHLAAAVAIGADEILTYDERMLQAANHLGLPAVSPGRTP
jgi:predicted nucleic acid-binding protein